MARRKANLDSIFTRTEPAADERAPTSELPAEGRTMSVGVGLKESEVAALDVIAGDLDVARNALLRYAVRRFLLDYQASRFNLAADVEVPEVKKRLRMP